MAMRSDFPVLLRFCATALLCCCVAPAAMAAEPAGGTTPQAGISRDQADAMLLELREIRKLLENIDQKGLAQAAAQPRKPRTATVTIDPDRPAMGSADAPVTVVEFTDYQCPFCRRFTQSTFPLIQKQYIDTGKVRWVVRDLPLAFHANARKAGQSVHCANEQGKFWEMRDTLFKNSAKLGEEDLRKYAGDVGLDVSAFDSCLASDRHMAERESVPYSHIVTPHTEYRRRALVEMSRGCPEKCRYCWVSYNYGRLRCYPVDAILGQVDRTPEIEQQLRDLDLAVGSHSTDATASLPHTLAIWWNQVIANE